MSIAPIVWLMRPLTRLTGQVTRVHYTTCRRPSRIHDPSAALRALHSSPWSRASEASSSKRKDEESAPEEPVFIASGSVELPGPSRGALEREAQPAFAGRSTRSKDSSSTTMVPDEATSPGTFGEADSSPTSYTSTSQHHPSPQPTPLSPTPSITPRPQDTPISPLPPPTSIPSEWRKTMENHFRRLTRESEKKLTEVGLKINEVTGYDEVERLKRVVAENESRLSENRSSARSAKVAYDSAVQSRSNAQHDVNILLERKHSWTDTDVSAFTSLVRQDHTSSNNVTTSSAALRDAETKVDTAFTDLTKSILQRYHEEQVWSDKIRNVSTWMNLAGLVINLVVFVGAIAFVEPWKRRRLVERVEERMGEMMARVEGEVKEVARLVAPQAPLVEEERRPFVGMVVEDSQILPIDSEKRRPPMPWLDGIFQSPIWRKTSGLISEPSLETDLALAGGVCVTLGIALGTIITNLIR